MADEQTPEQIAELQRKNCIFCRIISGEIESKKVFENDKFLAILDIRPATNGHTILLPKEHVPILPLLSEEHMDEFFKLGTKVANAVQDAMISQRVTMFLASGYAAGQQAPHLLMHIIPRDKGDGLEMLDLEKMDVTQADAIAISSTFAQATTQMLIHRKREDLTLKPRHIHKKRHEESGTAATTQGTSREAETTGMQNTTSNTATEQAGEPQTASTPPTQNNQTKDENTVEFETTNEALETALSMSPDLRNLIIAQPDLVSDYVRKSPKLSKLFEGVNIRALSLILQRQDRAREAKEEQDQANAKKSSPDQAQVAEKKSAAIEMTQEELFTFIDSNEGLRTWILNHPDELAAHIGENPRLAQFFDGVDIVEFAKRYRAYRQTKGDA